MSKDIELKDFTVIKDEVTMQDALIKIVQRTDIDPDRLEKFLELQIKMENRQAERAFNEAMAKFQGLCPIIKKNKKISFENKSGSSTKYDYSPLDEIVHIIKPILSKCDLSFSFDVEETATKSNLKTTISHKDGHNKTFNYLFDSYHDDARMNQSQRRKSAITYAKRACLENALGLVTAGEDDDATRAVDTVVSGEQLAMIKELMIKADVSEKMFLDKYKVSSFEELSSYEAKKAIHALKVRKAACIK
jgi:hypothetical protein